MIGMAVAVYLQSVSSFRTEHLNDEDIQNIRVFIQPSVLYIGQHRLSTVD